MNCVHNEHYYNFKQIWSLKFEGRQTNTFGQVKVQLTTL